MTSGPNHEHGTGEVPRPAGRLRARRVTWTAMLASVLGFAFFGAACGGQSSPGVAASGSGAGSHTASSTSSSGAMARAVTYTRLHARPPYFGLPRPGPKSRWWRRVPNQRRPGQRPEQKQPEVRNGRPLVPLAVARPGAVCAAACPEARRGGEVGTLHTLARDSPVSRAPTPRGRSTAAGSTTARRRSKPRAKPVTPWNRPGRSAPYPGMGAGRNKPSCRGDW